MYLSLLQVAARSSFHQLGIELVLADDLAELVADLVTGTTIAVPVSVGILGRKLTLIGSPRRWTGIRSDLLDRADPDAICLAQRRRRTIPLVATHPSHALPICPYCDSSSRIEE